MDFVDKSVIRGRRLPRCKMPFQAACPFCPTKVQVSRKAVGSSVCCPRCGSYFTAAPPEDAVMPSASRLPGRVVPVEGMSDRAGGRVARPVAIVEAEPLLASTRVVEPKLPASYVSPPSYSVPPEYGSSTPSALAGPDGVNGWGLLGFLCGGVALLFASFDAFHCLTVPLCVCGLLLVLLGFFRNLVEGKGKNTWLLLGGMSSGAVLAVATFRPSLLNSYWEHRAPADIDHNLQLLASADNRKVIKELPAHEWVDAASGSIRMGDLHVRIDRVAVEVPRLAAGDAGRSVLITLLLANTGHVRTVTYEGQASKKHVVILRDNKGRSYAPRDFPPETNLPGQTVRAVLRPVTHLDDILAFEPPPADVEYLELEIPAAAWQGQGTCKFRIPRGMIAWSPT